MFLHSRCWLVFDFQWNLSTIKKKYRISAGLYFREHNLCCWCSYIPDRGVPDLSGFMWGFPSLTEVESIPSWQNSHTLEPKWTITSESEVPLQVASSLASVRLQLLLCFACCSPAVIYVFTRLGFCYHILTLLSEHFSCLAAAWVLASSLCATSTWLATKTVALWGNSKHIVSFGSF